MDVYICRVFMLVKGNKKNERNTGPEQGSNLRPPVLEANALAIELPRPQKNLIIDTILAYRETLYIVVDNPRILQKLPQTKPRHNQ